MKTADTVTAVPDAAMLNRTVICTLPMDGTEDVTIGGRLIGVHSSRRDTHTDHAGEFASRPQSATDRINRCSACRWFELRVFTLTSFQDAPASGYLVYFWGATAVPGEQQRRRHIRADSAWSLVESLTQRSRLPSGQSNIYLSRPAAAVLAMASGYDKNVQDAYVNRAVP